MAERHVIGSANFRVVPYRRAVREPREIPANPPVRCSSKALRVQCLNSHRSRITSLGCKALTREGPARGAKMRLAMETPGVHLAITS